MTDSSTDGMLQIRLIIDGENNPYLSDFDGYRIYPHVFKYGEVYLSAGQHRINILYATRHARNNSGG